MYMDYIKLFAKKKCAMLLMKNGKQHLTDGMEPPNKGKIRTLGEKLTYKYFDIFEADTIKQVELKEKNLERISQANQKATRDKTV